MTTLTLRDRHPITVWAFALIALIATATGWDIFTGWRAQQELVNRQMETLAEAAASQIEGSIRAVDLLLEDAAKSVDLDRWPNDNAIARLQARVASFPEIRNLIVVNASGRMIGPNISLQEVDASAPSTAVFADREHFRYQREHWQDDRAYIPAPVISKLHNTPSIPIARPLRTKAGGFGGMVAAGVDPAYFETKLRSVVVDDGASAALLRRDGVFLARFPDGDSFRGRSVPDSALFNDHQPAAVKGVIRAGTLADMGDNLGRRADTERLVSYRALSNYPLVVTVSVPLPVAFQEWRLRVAQGLATVLLLSTAVLALAYLLERREAARAELAAKLDVHRRDLETRVAERTSDLELMLAERKRTGHLLEARLRLAEMLADNSHHDLLVATLDEICQITGSEIGFYHFLLADQVTLSLQAWSSRTTREFCQASASSQHYDIDKAGIWADCVRLRRSVIYNDYSAAPHRKGLPDGHAEVRRLLSVPIVRDGRIKAIIGVGNKPAAYTQEDLAVVETLAEMAWDLAEHKQAEDALAERTELLQRRYEALRALNGIAALPPGGTVHQLVEALALGAKHLGLPIGIISRIEDENYVVLHHCAPADLGLADSQTFRLGDTYCALTLKAGDVVAIPHMGQSDHSGHPCYQAFHLEAYIGAPVWVGTHRVGTVNFSSPTPYHRDFDDGDLEFMRLLARWVGSMLEREQTEAQVVAAKEAAEQQSQELSKSNNDLEQFAYVASHDLRQPLRMVSSYLSLIERRLGASLNEECHEFLGFAKSGAQQMDRLIQDLLEYSRVGRHGAPAERLNIAEMADEARHHLLVLIEETACTIEIDTEAAAVNGNHTELVRLFQNLIGNAIKYRAPDRTPRVAVRWQRQAGEWLVSVKDNGIGIPPEFQEEVFKIFRRLHGSSEYEGTGIGLAVCQKIVNSLGGRIWIESDDAVGTTFLFTLPAAKD